MWMCVFTVAGFNPFVGVGQNAGVAFVNLADWDKRPGAQNSATAIARRAFFNFLRIPDAQIFPRGAARRCRNLDFRPASIWKWKIAAILAMPA